MKITSGWCITVMKLPSEVRSFPLLATMLYIFANPVAVLYPTADGTCQENRKVRTIRIERPSTKEEVVGVTSR